MRLDKYIGNNSELSRRQIQQLARQSRLEVNGTVEKNPARLLQAGDSVTLDGELIQAAGARYFMLHKPAGIVCANSDGNHPTVLDLLDEPQKDRLQIAGRLDLDTTGLVLITDDGQWNHRVTSPRRACRKRYRVQLAEAISETTPARFAEGVLLHGEEKPTLPAALTLLDSHSALLEIAEGRYHQVKRMFAAVGNRVTALHREAIGPIELDALLTEGHYRALSAAEIASI